MKELQAKVKEIINRTYNVISVRVEVEGDIEFKAGQFLQVFLKADPELKRYLSISNSPTEKGYLEFTKKITESDFSQALKKLKPADLIKIQYPFGKFVLDETFAKIAFVSGGIGITPIRSIIKYAVDKNLGTDIVLIYANRTADDIAFKDDFAKMQQCYNRLKVIHVLSQVHAGANCRFGRVDSRLIKECLPDYLERKIYLCGPPAMVEAMKCILAGELAVAVANIVTENFQGY